MIVKIPYGKKMLDLDVGNKKVDICAGTDVETPDNEEILLKNALSKPINSRRIKDIAKDKKNVCIVINDITRPTPSKLILEAIFKELEEAKMPKSEIKILIANGNHRPATREELIMMIGEEIVNEYKIINHVATNDDELSYLGDTPL
ncbi:MAG: lactate racemase domain-containing protein, partial [Bacillota bacterium]|nr:lactate racemase domain-containing protein [Bacillota bacterium]